MAFADNPPVGGSLVSHVHFVSDLMAKEDQSAHPICQYEKGERDAQDTLATRHIFIATAAALHPNRRQFTYIEFQSVNHLDIVSSFPSLSLSLSLSLPHYLSFLSIFGFFLSSNHFQYSYN